MKNPPEVLRRNGGKEFYEVLRSLHLFKCDLTVASLFCEEFFPPFFRHPRFGAFQHQPVAVCAIGIGNAFQFITARWNGGPLHVPTGKIVEVGKLKFNSCVYENTHLVLLIKNNILINIKSQELKKLILWYNFLYHFVAFA